jgi:hypothetical protein
MARTLSHEEQQALQVARQRARTKGRRLPQCTCGAMTTQNEVERERRVYWCPRCGTYPFGNGFGPDSVPKGMK